MKKFTREEFLVALIQGIFEEESCVYLMENLYNDISLEEWEEMKEFYNNGCLVMEDDLDKILTVLNHLKPSTIRKNLNTGRDNGLYLTDEGFPCLLIYEL